jgi:hypothetical protein
MNMKKVKLPRRELSFNSLILLWEDKRRFYNRWKSITEKTRLMNECRQITSLFQTLNFAIKSVADNRISLTTKIQL